MIATQTGPFPILQEALRDLQIVGFSRADIADSLSACLVLTLLAEQSSREGSELISVTPADLQEAGEEAQKAVSDRLGIGLPEHDYRNMPSVPGVDMADLSGPWMTCPACNGRDLSVDERCKRCGGTGQVKVRAK